MPGRSALTLVLVLAGCSSSDPGSSPSLDSGPPAQDGPAPGTDAGPRPDTLDPNKQLCDCLAQQPRPAYCLKQAVTCQVATDCCVVSSIPCGAYGNKYACNAGKCEIHGCATQAECVAYAQTVQQPDAQEWTCHSPTCPGTRSTCGLAIKSCATASDCCRPLTVPCGLYYNHWTCDAGKCNYVGCLDDSECVSYAKARSLPDFSTYVCLPTSCYTTGYCIPRPKPCSQPVDCCTQSTVPCGVYSNRFRCENGACVMDDCTGKQDCLSYASALNVPDADSYNCVVY